MSCWKTVLIQSHSGTIFFWPVALWKLFNSNFYSSTTTYAVYVFYWPQEALESDTCLQQNGCHAYSIWIYSENSHNWYQLICRHTHTTTQSSNIEHLPICRHLKRSKFVGLFSSVSRNVISPIRYMWPAIDSHSSISQITHPVLFTCCNLEIFTFQVPSQLLNRNRRKENYQGHIETNTTEI